MLQQAFKKKKKKKANLQKHKGVAHEIVFFVQLLFHLRLSNILHNARVQTFQGLALDCKNLSEMPVHVNRTKL